MTNNNFRYINDWAAIRLVDSFVKINKAGTGNGEASLYLGSKYDPDIFRFFGEENFDAPCVIYRADTIEFLESIRIEYERPRYSYRNEVSIRTWNANMEEVKRLPDELHFNLTRKRQQDKHGRVYAQELSYKRPMNFDQDNSSAAYAYDIIRRIAIPEVSFLMLTQLADSGRKEFYTKLFYDPDLF